MVGSRTMGRLVLSGIIAASLSACLGESGSNPSDNPGDPDNPVPSQSPAEPYGGKAELAWQNPLPRVNHIRDIDFPTSTIGYLVGDRGMVLKTTDGGRTMVDMGILSKELIHVRFFDPERGIILGDNGFIMSTGDGGTSWKSQNVGSSYFHGLCLDPSGKAMAVGELGTMLKSTDHGKTWALKNSGRTEPLLDCQFLGPDTVFVTQLGFLLKSMDGGETWTTDTLFEFSEWHLPAQYHLHKLHFTRSGTGYALNGPHKFRSSDGFRTWSPWGRMEQITRDLAITTKGIAHAVGVNGAIQRGNIDIVDWNTEWSSSHSGISTTLLAVDFPADDTGYAAGEFGEVLRTVDGGDSWQSLSSAVTREDLRAVHFVDKEKGFAVGSAGAMLKTANGGAAWTRMDGAAARGLGGVHFLDGDVGCVVGEGGTALWTRDGGKSWILGGTGTQTNLQSVRLVDDLTAYAGTGSYLIKTVDGGVSWNPVGLPNPEFAPGWDIGDSLFFTGVGFLPSHPDLALMSPGMLLLRRPRTGISWDSHVFSGVESGFHSQSPIGDSLIFGFYGSNLLRVDVAKKNLQYQAIPAGQPLNALHCPEAGTCFAVGDKGVIVKFAMP